MTESKKAEREIPVEYVEGDNSSSADRAEIPEEEIKKSAPKIHKVKEEKKKKRDEYKEKFEELNEHFMRVRAEFANYKKRVEREQIEFSDYIKGEMIKSFLPILDDFDHMIRKTNNNTDEISLLEGAKIIYEKFVQLLKDYGVEKIEALGQDFNPEVHEAMMMQPVDEKDKNSKVIDVFQTGYKLKDRLLRPSRVVVGNFKEEKKNS